MDAPLTHLGRYILEEWAEDYRAGRLDRREFLRRVLAMAGSQAAALALLGLWERGWPRGKWRACRRRHRRLSRPAVSLYRLTTRPCRLAP